MHCGTITDRLYYAVRLKTVDKYQLKGNITYLFDIDFFFIETLHTARRTSHWMKNEIKSVGHRTHCHGNAT